MKAPITPAQAWAAIAEASGWDVATKLERSQAERIAELERESETNAKAYGLAIVKRDNLRHELKVAQEGWRCECSTDDACRFARERDALRDELAEIDAAEPVAWSRKEDDGNIYDCISRVYHDGRHPFNVPLFTRPMPAQDVTELVEALEEYGRAGVGNSTDWRVQLSALRLATAALSKYKGAK